MNIKIRKILLPILAVIILNTSCAITPVGTSETKNSPFTHGNVQLSIKKGITTQAEVLEKFGAPNIATIDGSGHEVWTYQKYATVATSNISGVYATVIVAGVTTSSSGFEQSSKTMTLILKFDESKTVIDFKSMTTNF
jgi:hypothetical protein